MSVAERNNAAFVERPTDDLAVTLACIVYLVGFAGYSFFGHRPDEPAPSEWAVIRFITYLAPLALLAPAALGRALPLNPAAVAFLAAYLFLGSVAYLTVVRDAPYFLNETIIIAFVIVSFAPRIKVEARQIEAVFYASVLYLIISFAIGDHHDIRLFQLLEDSNGGADIESSFDNHQGGLVAPIFAVFFFAIGAKLQFLTAVTLAVLGGKRIGVLAIAFGVLAALYFRRRALRDNRRARFAALLLCLCTFNVFGANLTSISEYLYRNSDSRVDIEVIMLGRHEIGAELSREVANRSTVESVIGFGAGSANRTTTEITKGRLTLPHNDWLKLLYDYGWLGSALVTTFLALVFSSSSAGAAIAVANAVMMTTDNVMVYLYYQFPIVLMLAHAELREFRARRPADNVRSLGVDAGGSRKPR